MDLVQDLLESKDESLRLIGTLSLYGAIYYKMNLHTGDIEWRGIPEKLFNDRTIYTFDHLMHMIRPQHGLNRLQKIFNGTDQFECVWDSLLDDKYWMHIYESGKLKVEDNKQFFIYGALNVYPGYAPFDEQDNLWQFRQFIQQSMETPSIKSLVICSIDNTSQICSQYSVKFLEDIITKFDDRLGKIDSLI